MADQFLDRLAGILATYLETVAEPREYLSLLRWQIAQGHRLDDRATRPGHVTTSALIVSPDYRETLLIDHIVIGRWLQPGGHYEAADAFHLSAMREAIEETSIIRLARADQIAFAQALTNPPEPNARLLAAKRRHAELIGK